MVLLEYADWRDTLIYAIASGDRKRRSLAPGDLVACDGWVDTFGIVVSNVDDRIVVLWTTPPGLIGTAQKPGLFNNSRR